MSERPSAGTDSVTAAPVSEGNRLVELHLRVGWWSLLVFLTLGAVLEGMHGFKVRWYLDVSNEVRRLTWTLAHAHGALVGLLQIAFAATVAIRPRGSASEKLASRCLLAAGLLLPGGFFLGGLIIQGGDPSVGILLVPVGAVLLFAAVLMTARNLRRRD